MNSQIRLENAYFWPFLSSFWEITGQDWFNVDPNKLIITFQAFFTSVSLFVEIDQEMRSRTCGQTDRITQLQGR